MGDTKSWLIFLTGLAVVSVIGVTLLVWTGLVLSSAFRPRSAKDNSKPKSKLDIAAAAAASRRDNRTQALIIAAFVIVMALVGIAITIGYSGHGVHWLGGAAVGAFAGLVSGLIASGAWIMVIRFWRV